MSIDHDGDSPSQGDPAGPDRRPASLEQLERGLAVLQTFSRQYPALTVSDVSRLTGINRASARRILLTLEQLGHLRTDGRYFSLTPRVLSLGWSYFSSLGLDEIARPVMRQLTAEVQEACSIGTLDPPHVVYVAREYGEWQLTVSGGVGSRLPAHPTGLGQALLAYFSDAELDDYLTSYPLKSYTDHTITDHRAFKQRLNEIAVNGWVLVDQELELGLRSLAVPLFGSERRPVAALSISASSARTSAESLLGTSLAPLREAASTISTALSRGAGRSAGF
jgi:IclR family pca regulon transcriptional regulator